MTALVSLVLFAWYLFGLALLFIHNHLVWGIIGIFFPVIPYVYSAIVLVDKFFR